MLGQFAPRSQALCAHLINCVYGTRLQSNAAWGTLKVDNLFRKRYPELSNGVRDGEDYPGVRVNREVCSGDEILLRTYGSGYWQRYHREQSWSSKNTLYCGRLLTPRIKETIFRHDEIDLARSERSGRRNLKRPRE